MFRHAAAEWNTPYLDVVPPFYDHPLFLDACARWRDRCSTRSDPERVIFSFHGLPERHCIKSDESGEHCLKRPDCCDRLVDANRNCYRAQCFATARGLADLLRVPVEKRIICFQSRLGRTPWIRPYTDEVVVRLAREGVKRAVISSPAFVADCLETIEELGMRAVKSFRESGGEVLTLVPAVNASDAWADAVVTLSREAYLGNPGGFAPAAPLRAHSRGPMIPAPFARLARAARSPCVNRPASPHPTRSWWCRSPCRTGSDVRDVPGRDRELGQAGARLAVRLAGQVLLPFGRREVPIRDSAAAAPPGFEIHVPYRDGIDGAADDDRPAVGRKGERRHALDALAPPEQLAKELACRDIPEPDQSHPSRRQHPAIRAEPEVRRDVRVAAGDVPSNLGRLQAAHECALLGVPQVDSARDIAHREQFPLHRGRAERARRRARTRRQTGSGRVPDLDGPHDAGNREPPSIEAR